MNEHEIDRIAAAMNQLRPDWPVKSLRTLLSKPQIADRPRRDVTVALAWVACETATATPARVLEAGPWWRAAAIEGQAHARDVAPVGSRCTVCGEQETRCQSLWALTGDPERDGHQGRHEFTRPHARDVDITPTVVEVKGHIQHETEDA
jgi:hypothetical protein